ncbi:MAG: hypothetical protein WCL16_10715 [bacterium]
MKYKDDWPEARGRLTNLWEGKPADRPCIAVAVSKAQHTILKPADKHDRKEWGSHLQLSNESLWLDPDFVIPDALSKIDSTWWGGEAIPSYLLMGGWVISLGGRPRFDARTIWFDTFAVDFDKPHPFHHNPHDPWVTKFFRLYSAMAKAAGKDDFLVGSPAILPVHDLLSMHLGTQEFMTALYDHPEWMLKAILDGAKELIQVRAELRQQFSGQHDFWYGNAGWMPFWAPTEYIGTQSDLSCMLSPDHFEQFVVPELDLYGKAFGAMWYHLDGGDAVHHLPRLLSLPYMRAIQYVPHPGEPLNGVAHLPMYRKIQEAGRIVHIEVTMDQVEPLCRALDPSLLMLDVSWMFKTTGEAQDLLESAKRWTSAKSQRSSSLISWPAL